MKIFLQIAIIIAIILGGCSSVPSAVTVTECKANAVLDVDHAADQLCPADTVKWDDCQHSESIMTALSEKLEACDAVR